MIPATTVVRSSVAASQIDLTKMSYAYYEW